MVDAHPAKPSTISVSRQIPRPPAALFDAWLDPHSVGRWLFATPTGTMTRVELDPRVGGTFHIAEQRGDTLAVHTGTFVTLDRPHRIIFDFTADPSAPPTRVTVSLVAAEAGTLVTLSHPLAPEWAAFADRARQGWSMILANFAATLTGGHREPPRS